jgi:hypothetical protein
MPSRCVCWGQGTDALNRLRSPPSQEGELQRASVVRFGLEFGIYAAASR